MVFTRIPDNPTHVIKGDNATLVWEYSVDDRQKELQGILWSVADKVTGNPISMVIETKSGNRSYAGSIPEAYKGRVSIEGQATLIIQEVTLDDSIAFSCALRAELGSGALDISEEVNLIVTGMCTQSSKCKHLLYTVFCSSSKDYFVFPADKGKTLKSL